MKQTPTIGRVVHYRPGPNDLLEADGDVCAAIITRVWSERCVNLTIFYATAALDVRTSVEIEDEPGQEYRWSWPPLTVVPQ